MLRWLLPLFAVFALLGNAVAAFAAAGTFGESECCCPDPKACKCHDHDGPKPASELKKCGGDAQKVAPHPQVAIAPELPAHAVAEVAHAIVHAEIVISTQHVPVPEKPPF